MMRVKKSISPLFYCCFLVSIISVEVESQTIKNATESKVGEGWAGNSVNTVVFRKNALCSFGDTQYISYYNKDGFVVLGKRKLSSTKWELKTTNLNGNVKDAHNSISIMIDGEGYLHLSWDQHNSRLRYCKSIKPGSLEMTTEMSMAGKNENSVSYPEFYSLPGGDLLFLYRDGQSGQGNLVVNRYDLKQKKWVQLHNNLLDGEKKRNAYWQACVDKKGTIHISWVWRETPDVASNHDLCYARSRDGGYTWENSKGETYTHSIKSGNAEYASKIPEGSELINQTSMCVDEDGNPIIASYWRKVKDKDKDEQVPQYNVVYQINGKWVVENLGFRKTEFSLSGGGTKRIPIARPQVIAWIEKGNKFIGVIFRDEERKGKVSIAVKRLSSKEWRISDYTKSSVGSWEPLYDIELWNSRTELHLFVQESEQQDSEGLSTKGPTQVRVIEIKKLD